MSQRRFLEDNENIHGEGKPQRYAASQDTFKVRKLNNSEDSVADWFEVCSVIGVTYVLIAIIWVLCIIGIEQNFKATVGTFLGLFVLFVVAMVFYWYKGQHSREELEQILIRNRQSENVVEM